MRSWDGPVGRLTSNSPKRLEELCQRHAQGAGQALQRVYADVALAALDTTHVVPVQTGPGRELFLRQLGGLAQLANPFSNQRRQRFRHERHVGELNTIGLHTIVFIYRSGEGDGNASANA